MGKIGKLLETVLCKMFKRVGRPKVLAGMLEARYNTQGEYVPFEVDTGKEITWDEMDRCFFALCGMAEKRLDELDAQLLEE